jgi:transposase
MKRLAPIWAWWHVVPHTFRTRSKAQWKEASHGSYWHIGIDVHKNQSQICILTDEGELVEQRIRTVRDRFASVLGGRCGSRILIEASTESEWVARCLEGLGHEVVVADPNFAPMYSTRSRRVKTDRRDAQALAQACRLGAYRAAHRSSDEQRHVRARLSVREALVRTRSRYISLIRALLRREGLRVGSGSGAGFLDRLEKEELPDILQGEIAPLLEVMGRLNEQIARLDRDIAELSESDAVVRRLRTLPGVGPITAASFVATLDRVDRFRGAHQVESYLGLVPREMSSGERQHRGRITKAGGGRTRWLLVEAAWSILRWRRPSTEPLWQWTDRIAHRRGRRVAAVALARRLAGILYAMWRDGSDYDPVRMGRRPRALVAS